MNGVGDEMPSPIGEGFEALAAGNWTTARDSFERVLAGAEIAEARFGLAAALF